MMLAHAPRPELVALTSLRGIAALFVLVHHFVFVLLDDIGRALPSKFFMKSYLWVDLFFLLSGFVLAYVYQYQFVNNISRGNYFRFMRARFARVYPLHIFMLGFFVLLEVAQWLMVAAQVQGADRLIPPFTGSETPLTLLSNIFLLQTFHWDSYWNQPAWSIGAEWLVYFIVPYLLLQFYRAEKLFQLIAVVIVLSVLGSIEAFFGDLGLHYAGWPMLLRCGGEAILGIIAYGCYRHDYFLRVASGAMAMPWLVLNCLLLALPIPAICSVFGFFWLVLSAARVPAHSGQLLAWSPLVYVGKISFATYMFHWLVLELLRIASLWMTGKPIAQNLNLHQQWAVFFVATLVVFIVSPFLYRFIEVPWRKRLAS